MRTSLHGLNPQCKKGGVGGRGGMVGGAVRSGGVCVWGGGGAHIHGCITELMWGISAKLYTKSATIR